MLVLLFVGILFWGCKKNDSNETNIPISPVKRIKTTLTGIVTNELGNFIQGAFVSIEGKSTLTDNNGLFLFQNIEVPEDRYYVRVKMNNYFESGAGGIANDNGVTSIQIKLLSMGNAKNLNTSSGGSLNFDGATLKFPSSAFSTASGSQYSGIVKVFARAISPSLNNFSELILGGDLAYIMPDGSSATLESYGMISVTLQDETGNELKIAKDKTVEVRFPIAEEQLSSAASEIPLLSLDSTTGIWKKEGIAKKEGNFYAGFVSHFSTWNVDYPIPNCRVRGRILDCNNLPLPGATIIINKQYQRNTDENGYYTISVPISSLRFEVRIFGETAPLVQPLVYRPIQGINNVPDLILSPQGYCPTYITGTINRCGNAKQFYIRALWGSTFNEGTRPQLIQGDSFKLLVTSMKPIKINITSDEFNKDTLISAIENGFNKNIGQLSGCIKIPIVKTTDMTSIGSVTASSGGEVLSAGGGKIISRGVIWNTSPNPTVVLNTKTNDGEGVGAYQSNLTGLAPLTTYYVRAYATNSAGTTYGNEVRFTTTSGNNSTDEIYNPNLTYGRVNDIEGNSYRTIEIGNQVWMADNLRSTKYRNGTPILNVTVPIQFYNYKTGVWCYYNNDSTYNIPYGKLYNWYAVTNSNQLCPIGWHVPSVTDWNKLIKYIDNLADTTCPSLSVTLACVPSTTAGSNLKSASVQYWLSPNIDANNSSGFSGLPGGYVIGKFDAFGKVGFWWSSTRYGNIDDFSRYAAVSSDNGGVSTSVNRMGLGLSVRCVKD